MNEKDLEKRLHSVIDGPQPSTPPSLRNFLHELPETSARRSGPLAWLRGVAGGFRGLVSPVPAVRRAELAFAVSAAVVVGLVGGGLLMSARQHPAPAATPSLASETATAKPTPRRSVAAGLPQYKFMLKNITGFQWAGILSTEDGNDKQAMPVAAVSMKSGGYVGVSSDEFGMNGLVFSQDGIYWNWDPPTVVDPSGVTLTAIATDGKGQLVVVGAAEGSGGTKDGRIYTSADGQNWTAVTNATTLFGGTAIRTVVHGPTGYVALGWNDGDPASRTIREWLSTDGVSWYLASGVPIVGLGAYVLPIGSGYVLSGSAQTASLEQPNIWYSSDGRNWLRAKWMNQDPVAMGLILSATVTSNGIVAIVKTADGSGTKLFQGSPDGVYWTEVTAPNEPSLGSVASIEGPAGRLLVGTAKVEDGHVYVSTDDGSNWSIASNLSTFGGAPSGQTVLQLGVNSAGQSAKVLCYGHPGYMMGVWLGYAAGV